MKEEHGTVIRGADHYLSRFTIEECIKVLRRLDEGESMRAVARDYEVASRTIQRIRYGESWNAIEAHLVYAEQQGDPLLGVGL